MHGYVYVLSNPNDSCVKIGHSIYGGFQRAKSIDYSDIDGKFTLEFEIFCFRPDELELDVHSCLDEFRRGRKELFDISIHGAIKAIIDKYSSTRIGCKYNPKKPEPELSKGKSAVKNKKVSMTFRIDKDISDNLDRICVRHGDATWHIEQALSAYLASYAPFNAPEKQVVVAKKKPDKRFVKPIMYDLKNQFLEKGSKTYIDDAQAFYDHYESNGWKVGKNPMKNWKSAVNNWIRMGKTFRKDGAGMLGTDISDLMEPQVTAGTADALEFMKSMN